MRLMPRVLSILVPGSFKPWLLGAGSRGPPDPPALFGSYARRRLASVSATGARALVAWGSFWISGGTP